MQDRDSLTKDSPIALLNALYQCQDFVFVDSTHNPSLTKSNITKTFGYKSSFYLSFIAHKDSLNDTYLQARKAIYKTINKSSKNKHKRLELEQQDRFIFFGLFSFLSSNFLILLPLQGLDSKARESKFQEIQRAYIKKQREQDYKEE